MTSPETYHDAAELVRAALLSLGRAAAKLRAAGEYPPEYYEINRAWLELEKISKKLNVKGLGR